MTDLTELSEPMNLPRFELPWTDLKRYVDFDEDQTKKSGKPGVYVWGFELDGWFIPHYVGKTNNLFERAFQHMGNLYGGLYSLPDFDEMIRNVKEGLAGEFPYFPDGPARIRQRMDPQMRPQFDRAIEAFRITMAETPSDCETAKAEQSLAHCFGLKRLATRVSAHEHYELTVCAVCPPIVREMFKARGPVRIAECT